MSTASFESRICTWYCGPDAPEATDPDREIVGVNESSTPPVTSVTVTVGAVGDPHPVHGDEGQERVEQVTELVGPVVEPDLQPPGAGVDRRDVVVARALCGQRLAEIALDQIRT